MNRFSPKRALAAAMTATALLTPAVPAVAEGDRLTVMVVVIDSLMPHEVDSMETITPTLDELKANGTWFTESRSVFSAETIPNHVAMMTGRYPEFNGIPTNNFWDRKFQEDGSTPTKDQNLSLPSELEVPTLFGLIRKQCPDLTTASVMSKGYLWEVFSACDGGGDDCSNPPGVGADLVYDPTSQPTYIPESGHTPDVHTMTAARDFLAQGADFVFVNLGDVDRSGHMDETGPTGKAMARHTVLADTDTQVRILVEDLKRMGRWENTVLIINSDHGMDWSTLNNYINLTPQLETLHPGTFLAVDNGGTDSVYLLHPEDPAHWERAVEALAAIRATKGVEEAFFVREPDAGIALSEATREAIRANLLPETSKHENLGDIVASAHIGFRFTESGPSGNPIPGNHGHKITLHNTFLVTGGAPFLKRGQVIAPAAPGELDHRVRDEAQSENIDIAPTVAWLLGMKGIEFDGRPIREAFDFKGAGMKKPMKGSCGAL